VVSAVAADLAAVAADSASLSDDRLDLLGAPLDILERREIEQRLTDRIHSADTGLLHVVTLNPEYVVAARSSPVFRSAVERAELSVPDGAGVVLAVRWLDGRRITRVTGVDLANWLLTSEQLDPARVFLLGTAASLAELHGRHPLRVVGRWGAGTPDPDDDAESIDRVRERDTNALLVGYGAPAQVLWIERNRAALTDAGVRVAIGVGGALDYLAGTVSRAPAPVRALGLEWAYRLAREPWRWRRQMALPRFADLVFRSCLDQRFRSANRCRMLCGDEITRSRHVP
jgi:N-acetylglucosaminyldiphosphoundecaprenol N-acetyl-beta-D-mannosaminyltransferase